MKIMCISDTHNQHEQLELDMEGIDFLIHTGDFTSVGKEKEVRKFNKWIGTLGLDKEHIIVISGNHDWFFERFDRKKIDGICTNFTYLEQESYECDGIKFYGEPRTPYFYGWAFNVPRGEELKKVWGKIPEDTDILLTHGPPLEILDANKSGEACGCQDLYNRVMELNLKAHIFGHIHESAGMKIIDGITFINASVLNDSYELVNKPIIIEII